MPGENGVVTANGFAGADNDVRPGHDRLTTGTRSGSHRLPRPVGSVSAAGRGCLAVLLRLAYLGVANALAMLRLLPMSVHAKDAEILALRTRSPSSNGSCTAIR